jgi:hypothetical protein
LKGGDTNLVTLLLALSNSGSIELNIRMTSLERSPDFLWLLVNNSQLKKKSEGKTKRENFKTGALQCCRKEGLTTKATKRATNLNSASLLKSMAVDLTTESDAIVGEDALLRDGRTKDLPSTIFSKESK